MTTDDPNIVQKSLVVVLEAHSFGSPTVGDTVVTQYASLYLASGVTADEVYGIADMQQPGTSFVRVAERLALSRAEALANELVATLSRYGIPTEMAGMYDE